MSVLPGIVLLNLFWGFVCYIFLSAHSSVILIGMCTLNLLSILLECILFNRSADKTKVIGLSVARNVFFLAAFFSSSVVFFPANSIWMVAGFFLVLLLVLKKVLPMKELVLFVLPFLSIGTYIILMFQISYWQAESFKSGVVGTVTNSGVLSSIPRYKNYANISFENREFRLPVGSEFVPSDLQKASSLLGATFVFIK
ncbi:hypothetical protein ACLVWU_08605 [Bdellovibrio sp. HCB290]|uniref:hypothetical protein n=1 Tax=Bdellovibrio sp. HCB290 TaxID=3394356 RepID=UPI0039B6D7F6